MSTFAQLKKSNDNLSRLLTEVDKVNQPQQSSNSNNDDRFWRPELDKSGNGYAVIRFLPESEGEELPRFVSSIMGFKVRLVSGILRTL